MIVSLKYCSKCLLDLCPELEKRSEENIRFFVPTKDYMMRDFFAYIEIKKEVMRQLCHDTAPAYIINLYDIATLLHLEQGLFPSEKRAHDIQSFFDYQPRHIPSLHYHNDMPKFEMVG